MLKTIASNTAAQLVAKFFGAGLTLLTTYYIIRVAGLDLYGDLTKILVLVAVGMTAIDFGLNAEAIRSIPTPKEAPTYAQRVLFARLLLSVLAVLALNLFVAFLPGNYSSSVKALFWLGSLSIIFQGIYTSGNMYFQYHLSLWRGTISVVAGSLFGTLLTLFFLFSSPTLASLVLASTLGYLLMAIITLSLLPRTALSPPHSWFSVFITIQRAIPLGSILVLSVLASKLDTIILGIFRSSSEVGEYGFAYRIFDVILVLPAFTMNALYPLLVRERDRGKSKALLGKTTLTLGLISLAVGITVWFFAPAINYVRPNLSIAVTSLRYLALSLPLFYVTSPLMWSLITHKKDRQVAITYALALALNFTLNYYSVPRFGAPAAALTTGITELFILLSLLYFSRI